jgi:hypothetical protein
MLLPLFAELKFVIVVNPSVIVCDFGSNYNLGERLPTAPPFARVEYPLSFFFRYTVK